MKRLLLNLLNLSLIIVYLVWPWILIWMSINERVILKLEECSNYRGNVQPFLRECEIIENDIRIYIGRELWVEMKEFQWSQFLVLLFIVQFYKILNRLGRLFHQYTDGRKERKYGQVKRDASMTEFIRNGNHDKINLSS